MPPNSSLRSLLVAPFRTFFLARLVSELGSSLAPVALALAVLSATGSAADLGIVLACQLVPQLVLTLVGGAVADRFSRRAVLVVAHLGAGLSQGAVALVLLAGQYSLVVVAALEVANGACSAFASSAVRGIVPEVAPIDRLQQANALLASTRSAVRILGPAAAGVLSAFAGAGTAIAVDAVSYLLAAALLVRLRLPSSGTSIPAGGLVADIRDGWRAFNDLSWVRTVAVAYCLVNLVSTGPWQILGPLLTAGRAGPATWGLVVGARAVGLFAAGVVLYRRPVRRPVPTGLLACALAGLSLVALGAGPATPWLIAAAVVSGVGMSVAGITWDTALQTHVPRALLSRVASYDTLLSFVAIPIGQLAVGPATDRWSGADVALWCGIAAIALSLVPLADRTVRGVGTGPDDRTGR